MITTVTPNPCIDKTLSVEGFSIERTNRAEVLRVEVGGKGINVARAVNALGGESLCTGFDFSDASPSFLARSLMGEGIVQEFLTLPGSLRVCTKLFDCSNSCMIEINERGGSVSDSDRAALLELVAQAAARSSFLVLSGSLPAGLGSDFYAACIRTVRASGASARVVVDAEGESLRQALEERPFLIKPNEKEFADTFGVAAELPAIDQKAAELIAAGRAEMICVSLGERGAYLADRDGACFCPPARVTVRSLQAAGDSMVAGICLALEQGQDLLQVLACGTAAAAATVSRLGTEVGSRADFEAILPTLSPSRLR